MFYEGIRLEMFRSRLDSDFEMVGDERRDGAELSTAIFHPVGLQLFYDIGVRKAAVPSQARSLTRGLETVVLLIELRSDIDRSTTAEIATRRAPIDM